MVDLYALEQSVSQSLLPPLSQSDVDEGFRQANESPRKRYPKLLHRVGDEFNQVFNFILRNSYMQPHLHPEEKIERIYLVKGQLAVLYFDEVGEVNKITVLEEGGQVHIEVPAYTWHTYVMLADQVITYETMMGRYDPITWKEFASWAPLETSPDSAKYLESLALIIEQPKNNANYPHKPGYRSSFQLGRLEYVRP